MPKENELDLDSKVELIKSKIGPTLVSAALGIRQVEIIRDNSQNFEELLSEEHIVRVDQFLTTWIKISEFENEDIARIWFVNPNSWMKDDLPIKVIREGRFKDLDIASTAFVEDAWNL